MVMILGRDRTEGRSLCDMMRHQGIPALSVTAENIRCGEGLPLSCLVILHAEEIDPSVLPGIRLALGNIPIYAVTADTPDVRLYNRVDGCFIGIGGDLADRIAERMEEAGHRPIGSYSARSLSIGRDPTLFAKGGAVSLTKTEAMLLRLMMCYYPSPLSCTDAVLYAFPEGRSPEPSAIRTHVCGVNKKAEAVLGRPIVRSVTGKGYTLAFDE